MPYRRSGKRLDIPIAEDPTMTACRDFIKCGREGCHPKADVQAGFRAAAGVIVANQALTEKRELQIVT
jgi:hypothetical protein